MDRRLPVDRRTAIDVLQGTSATRRALVVVAEILALVAIAYAVARELLP